MVERNQIGMLDGHAMDVVRCNLTLGRTRRFTKMPTEPVVVGEVCSVMTNFLEFPFHALR